MQTSVVVDEVVVNFQYSIGDAKPRRRHSCFRRRAHFQYSIGDAPLPREPFGGWLDRVFAFQYSIGDATSTSRRPAPPRTGPFQYSIGDAVWWSLSHVLNTLSRTFNTPLEMLRMVFTEVAKAPQGELSILHWRCLIQTRVAAGAAIIFQYSIGDATSSGRP